MSSSRISVKSCQSSNSQKGFRTLIKSRFNHSVSKIQKNQQVQINTAEQNKNQMRKYIKSMKLKKQFNSSSAFKQALMRSQTKKGKNINQYQQNEHSNLLKKSSSQRYLKGQMNSPINVLNAGIQKDFSTKVKTSGIQNKINNSQINIQQNQTNEQQLQITKICSQSNNQNMNKMFLDLLQQKVSTLIKQNMKTISQFRLRQNHKNINILAKTKIFEKQIQNVLLKIKQIRENQGEDVSSSIIVLDKKVKIIQKLIAQKMAESESIKDKYLLSLKKYHRNLINTTKSSLSNTYYQSKEANFKDKKMVKRNVTNQSTNKVTYNAPKNDQYAIPVRQTHFNSDKFRQPLPRSSYNRQFLNYKGIPKDLLKKSKSNTLNIFNQYSGFNSKKAFRTSYQEDFMKKNAQKVDFKSLDCYKDKLTDLDISFNQRFNAKITNRENPQDLRTKESQQFKMNQKQHKKYYIKTRYPSKYLLTESRAVFNEKIKDQFETRVKSVIKHKNINDLKYRYQKLVTLS